MGTVRRMLSILLALAFVFGVVALPRTASAKELCFAGKTEYCLNDPFSGYWENNGGLPVFGYPITAAAPEQNRDTGQTYNTQWVERNRMEVHPENAGTPYEILLGLLGKDRLAQIGRNWQAEPREAGPKAGCLWFEQTGHNVCNNSGNLGFKTYWETHGLKISGLDNYARSLQLFGLPLTEPKMETNSSGDTVLTQWFERARFEWHPNNPDEYKVLLGLLGKEVRSGNTPPPPPPSDPCASTPDPVSARVRPAKCGKQGTIFSFDVFGFQANEEVGFWISDPDGVTVGTRQTINIGPEGAASGLKFDTNVFNDVGIWQVTFQGVSSGHQSIVYINVLQGDTPPPSNGDVCAKTPDPVSARVRPSKCEKIGTVFSLDVFGFQANEEIGYWISDPDGITVGTRQTVNIGPTGGVNGLLFDTDGLYEGVWQITFQGVSSGHQSIIYIGLKR